jgi:CRISPR-associated protein Cmr1
VYGGGVEPTQADPISSVRATEVRGQLRFWWRATRGGQFGKDVANLKRAEDLLWGSASGSGGGGPSRVNVQLTLDARGKPYTAIDRQGHSTNPHGEPLNIGHPSSVDSYAAFPLNSIRGASVLQDVRFSITVTVCETPTASEAGFSGPLAFEVEAALWAWATFGGIGARTRRGFGALRVRETRVGEQVDLPPAAAAGASQWLRERFNKYVVTGTWPEHVPHLEREHTMLRVLENPNNGDAIRTWRFLIDKLKAFRQQRPINGNRPGRNHWPEQDEVRRLTGFRSRRHANEISHIRKFPRAAFGLPLIIQYKRDDQGDGDPRGNNTVNVPEKERFASPLLLRPLATTGAPLGMAIVLAGSRVPNTLTLTHSRGESAVRSNLTKAEASAITKADGHTPLLNGETDVLAAFLKFL